MSKLWYGLWPTLPHHHVCHNAIPMQYWAKKIIPWNVCRDQKSRMRQSHSVSWSAAVVPRTYLCDVRASEWASVFDVKLLWYIVSLGPLNVLLAFKLCYCYYCCCYEHDKYVIMKYLNEFTAHSYLNHTHTHTHFRLFPAGEFVIGMSERTVSRSTTLLPKV